MDTTPFWMSTSGIPAFPQLASDLQVDVLVIGAGLAGITSAYLLKRAGKRVALIDRGRCVMRDSGHTTAHLTYVTDTRLTELAKTFGRNHARAAWEANLAGLDQIDANVRENVIDCDFRRVPNFLHARIEEPSEKDAAELWKEAELARELGFDAEFLERVPFMDRAGVRFANQGLFHPRKYLAALLERIPGDGSHVFENSEASEFHDAPQRVAVNGHTVTCEYVVVATHNPLPKLAGVISETLLQTKLALYSTYAVGARLPHGTMPEASWYDVDDPYWYLRVHRRDDGEYAILGGEDHKTGQESDTGAHFAKVEAMLHRLLPQAQVDHRWSGQVIETTDGLPYIGEIQPGRFIATGFAGNGMTFGTLSGIMARDYVLGVKNPWRDLFDPHRKTLSAAWDYLMENKDYPFYMVRDRLVRTESEALESVPVGEGRILRLQTDKVAVFREADGSVVKLSPVCTHMGCIVHWNQAEKTWDCPCHGSRFTPQGKVLGGPAESPLKPV